MAYVTGFAHDVFVSYSSIDNELIVPDGGQQRGWVELLVDKLRMQLKFRLGCRDCDILIDTEFVRSNLPVTTQILDAVRASAILLVVLSPAYLKSHWCDRERRTFLGCVQERLEAGSVVVVRTYPVEHDEQPEAFRDLHGIKFFTEVKGAAKYSLLGYPDPNERPFIDCIGGLCGELAQQLRRQRPKAGAYDPTVPTSNACVFVARATDDLEEREAALRSYLRQEGLEVLPSPQSRYPETSLEAYEAAMLRELERSCLFTQLLSGTRGRELEFAPGRRLPALQYELARRAQKPIMQWRAREQAVDTKDPQYRALLEGAQACGIEEFKRAVSERALRPPPPRPPPLPDPRLTVSIFVDADTRDNGLASQVVKALRDLGASCSGPPNTDIQETLKTAVQECHGIVLVYGRAGFPWLLARSCKLVRLGTEVARLPTLAVFEGPPSEKPEVPLTAPGLEIIDCRNGIDLDKLRQFVALLRK